MKKGIIIIGLIIGLLAGNLVYAQSDNVYEEKFRLEYEITQQYLEQARELIQQSGTDKGDELLGLAEQIQTKAADMGHQRRYRMAYELTLEAREKARGAMLINKESSQNQNMVESQMRRVDELIARVQSHISHQTRPEAVRIFETARMNQTRAWEHYRYGEYRLAVKLSFQAEKMIRGLMDRVQTRETKQERIQIQIEQCLQNMEQVAAMIGDCNNEDAERLFKKAQESLGKSQDFMNNGQNQAAENQLKSAQKMLRRVETLCNREGNLEQNIEKIRNRLGQLEEMTLDGEHQVANQFVDMAREHLQLAEKFCAQGNYGKCAANIKVAQMNLVKAEQKLGI